MGIDASLRATGIAHVPDGWRPGKGSALASIQRQTIGESLTDAARERERAIRISTIVDAILKFVDVHAPDSIFIEDYAFTQPGQARRIAEFVGALKHRLLTDYDLVPEPVTSSRWRKALIGVGSNPRGFPRGWIKNETHSRMRAAGAREWTGDEIDAFGVANAGLAECGKKFFTIA